GIAYTAKGSYEAAESEFKKALVISENDSETISAMGYAYAEAGRLEDARDALKRLNELARASYVSPYSLARIQVGLGEIDEAFDSLEKTYQERHGILTYLNVEPVFERLFIQILALQICYSEWDFLPFPRTTSGRREPRGSRHPTITVRTVRIRRFTKY